MAPPPVSVNTFVAPHRAKVSTIRSATRAVLGIFTIEFPPPAFQHFDPGFVFLVHGFIGIALVLELKQFELNRQQQAVTRRRLGQNIPIEDKFPGFEPGQVDIANALRRIDGFDGNTATNDKFLSGLSGHMAPTDNTSWVIWSLLTSPRDRFRDMV
jgi:hypothetical protein